MVLEVRLKPLFGPFSAFQGSILPKFSQDAFKSAKANSNRAHGELRVGRHTYSLSPKYGYLGDSS